jgi:hypothetical protein
MRVASIKLYHHYRLEAGHYSRAEAIDICKNALPGPWKPGEPFPELPIAEDHLVAVLERSIKPRLAR